MRRGDWGRFWDESKGLRQSAVLANLICQIFNLADRNVMKRTILTIAIGLASVSAIAEEANKPSATEAAPAEQEAPAQQEAPAAAAEPAPSATPAQEAEPQSPAKASPKPKAAHAPVHKPKAAQAPAAEAPKPQAAAGLSQSKFLGILYSEIAKRRPDKNSAGPGVVSASFRVNSSGKVDNVSIKSSTSPAHAEIVKKMLAKVQAPPPPTGVFEGVQDFKFH
jgi:hypothetical protein